MKSFGKKSKKIRLTITKEAKIVEKNMRKKQKEDVIINRYL